MPKELALTLGYRAIVDDEDFERLSKFRWFALREPDGRVYAGCRMPEHGKTLVRLHRYLLGLKPHDGRVVDHRDSDGLNNQKSNLRECTQLNNNHNRRKQAGQRHSRFKGVSWHIRNNRWIAAIRKMSDGKSKSVHLGYFKDEMLAAQAYDAAAREHHGEFARLNLG
jgi:hypothetical protein